MGGLLALRDAAPGAFCAMSAVLGGIVGSFLGVVIERVPAMLEDDSGKVNLLFPGSHCPDCQHTLAWWENIPLLSWCLLRGRCRVCRSAIPFRILLVELLSAFAFAAAAWWSPSEPVLFGVLILWCGLLPLTVIDARHSLLPDSLTLPLMWAGLLFHTLFHTLPLTDALYGAAAGYLSLWLLYWGFRLATGREGLGYGDFKLLAALGAWCGWQSLPTIVLLAGMGGIAAYIVFSVLRKNNQQMPFGPYLSVAGIVVFILQNTYFNI